MAAATNADVLLRLGGADLVPRLRAPSTAGERQQSLPACSRLPLPPLLQEGFRIIPTNQPGNVSTFARLVAGCMGCHCCPIVRRQNAPTATVAHVCAGQGLELRPDRRLPAHPGHRHAHCEPCIDGFCGVTGCGCPAAARKASSWQTTGPPRHKNAPRNLSLPHAPHPADVCPQDAASWPALNNVQLCYAFQFL